MGNIFLFLFLLQSFLCSVEFLNENDRPPSDRQNETYHSKFKLTELEEYLTRFSIFYCPNDGLKFLTDLILGAKKSISIVNSSFKSWIGCSGYDKPQACPASKIRDEELFPIFFAVLNKIHEGVEVKILVNDLYPVREAGKMDLLTYLQIAGAKIRYFRSVTFQHNKLIEVDGKKIAIHSINFSEFAFMNNRESGIFFDDDGGKILSYYRGVFEYDFGLGFPKTLEEYSQKDLDLVRNKTSLPVIVPQPKKFNCNTSSPKPIPTEEHLESVKMFVSPDFSFDYIMNGLDSIKSSIKIYIYEISDKQLANKLVELKGSGIDVTVFVSNNIMDEEMKNLSLINYKMFVKNGIKVRMSRKNCLSFAHLKYWIIDEESVWFSTANWSEIDYVSPPYDFPPFPDSKWRNTERNFDIWIKGKSMVQNFEELFFYDYDQGFYFS